MKNKVTSGNVDLELLKSSARGLLRYSNYFTEIIEELQTNKNYFITRPYILIHYPNDSSELGGGWHDDYVFGVGDSKTFWLNVNKLKNESLVIYPSVFSFLNFLNSLLVKILNRGYLKGKIITPDNDKYYVWNSKLLHSGLVNKGSFIKLNIVFRVSKRYFFYERSMRINEILKLSKQKKIPSYNFDQFNFIHLLVKKIYFKCLKYKVVDKKNILDLINTLNKNSHSVKPIISHALSILPQRINVTKINIFFIDFSSLYLYGDNFICIKRNAEYIAYFNDFLPKKIIESYQFKTLTNQDARKNNLNFIN
ncbi:hypothetical protein N9B80_01845 [Methylophilaceae bacterium]|nr:hypothetical protein [Methylophilaceae bacterium]